MDEKTLNNLQTLEQLFQHTCQICDPLDYAIRQRNLVYTLTNYLLLPLVEYRQEQEKLKAEECCKQTPTAEVPNAVESV